MDVFTHGVAGAVTGSAFGRPVLGAFIAISPDIVLIGKRKQYPTRSYLFLHSFFFIISSWFIVNIYDKDLGLLFFYCLLSHLILDLLTHGKTWAPCVYWPMKLRPIYWREWEFFNLPWFYGLGLTSIWCGLWL